MFKYQLAALLLVGTADNKFLAKVVGRTEYLQPEDGSIIRENQYHMSGTLPVELGGTAYQDTVSESVLLMFNESQAEAITEQAPLDLTSTDTSAAETSHTSVGDSD